MKKYILVLFLGVFIIPSIAFASWWNPFSWKVFHKKEISVSTQAINTEVVKTPEEKKNELKNQQPVFVPESKVTTKKEVKKNVPVANNLVKTIQPIQITDVCLNIEGIQAQIPSGYSSVQNICTLINVKDYCPNIHRSRRRK